ncbi:MAG TPA: sugar phosphate nucleotidyltransferase [Bacteroidia bacterium]|nr:sugar phosphate nucleotidyltransferase [Bacteroidia bacterium]
MNLIIPMAGKGTRMRPSTLTTPKPLFPIADKSIVEWLIYEVFNSSNIPIEEIAFIIHPDFGKQVESDLIKIAEKYQAKGKIYYQSQALGTAHAILCAKDSLKGNVLIAFADTLFKANFDIDINKDAIIWTKKVDNPKQYGIVVTDENKKILYFEEKPENPVSNEAIIGIYFFKDGENLKSELQYLIDNNIKEKGEYQLTNAMENMRQKGLSLYSQNVEKWLDCGNKDTTLYSHREVLISNNPVSSSNIKNINSKIIPPCYIADNVVIENSTIGPYVSIGENSVIQNTQIENSIVMKNTKINSLRIHQSIIGNNCQLSGQNQALLNMHISDYSQIELQ